MQEQSSNNKVRTDAKGNVFLNLSNGEVIGLSVNSISQLMGISDEQAKYVMREAIEIAIETQIETTDHMSSILVSIMNRIDNKDDVSTPEYEKKSFISSEDIAEICDISTSLSHIIFHEYKKPIQDDKDLDNFIDFMTSYIEDKYDGDLEKASSAATSEKNTDYINSILSQHAPEELMAEEDRLKLKYYRETRATISTLLEVSGDDAEIILSDIDVLKEFLQIDDKVKAQKILNNSLNGNQDDLIMQLNNRVSNIFSNISDNTIKNALDPSNYTPSKAPEPLPDRIDDTLRLCFKTKKRVTSTSLSKIFNLWDIKISAGLAQFIIEDGGFGGDGENSKRIVSSEKLEAFIKQLLSYSRISSFVSYYLKRVNDQVNGMFYK